jgi:hypothetical protein
VKQELCATGQRRELLDQVLPASTRTRKRAGLLSERMGLQHAHPL